ncbi:DUF4189 domain-containing protein [Xanthomonas campestris]|uniref:DUF4189 domain-containing protein n=1 Tax=Xanthomonas campestris TaxID=339 RepID=UPI002378D262|nr:DUF4189 domain-containing protein [Xanthomonas campestris]
MKIRLHRPVAAEMLIILKRQSMKAIIFSILLILTSLLPIVSVAQTACPVGVVPGSPQCGPDSGTSRGDSVAPPQPTGRWIKTWGAVVGSDEGKQGWTSTGKLNEEAAKQDALQKCFATGVHDCRVDMAYFNQCVAIAMPVNGGSSSIVTGKDEQVASGVALDRCKKKSASTCSIFFTECTEPFFEKF